MKKIEYIITGMRCQACAASVTNKVKSFKGINSYSLNLLSGILEVDADDTFQEDELIVAINSLGFKANIKNDNRAGLEKDNYFKLYQLIILIIFGILLMYVSMTNMLIENPPVFDLINMHKNAIGFATCLLILTLPIFVIGFKFYIPGIKFLAKLHPNMDSLVSIASITSFIYSLVYTIIIYCIGNGMQAHMYAMNLIYEASGIVIVLVYLGKYIEQEVKNKAKKSINNLVSIIPTNASLVLGDGSLKTICVNEIEIDNVLFIKNGDRIPVDGEIIDGSADLDVSSITGESNLKHVSKGEQVLAGSIVSNGSIKVKAIKVSSEATINNILALVSKSQLSKSKTSMLVDKISLYFVPIVLVISIIVFIVWIFVSQYDYSLTLKMFINTLTIACPCAIGLATPLANVASSLKALKLGLVYKNMDIVSKLKDIDVAVFDKTGTLTTGSFDIKIDAIYDKSFNDNDIIQISSSMEQYLNHPIAESFVKFAKKHCISLLNCDEHENLIGLGIKAKLNNKTYYLGNKKLLKSLNIESYYIENGTTLYLVEDEKVIAKILLLDELQEGVVELINYLKSNNIKTIMLTGDNKPSATYISNLLGLDECYFELLPNEKYNKLESIKKDHKVMYVGDGINDAPSLALADISITPYKSSDIANDSSDIYLLSNNMANIIKAFKLGKYTYNIIIINIFWAFIYNIIAMSFASGIFYSLGVELEPWMSASAMALSSICVVLTSTTISLRKYK